VYAFPISRRGEPVAIVVALQSERIGPVEGRIGLEGAAGAASFRQFVYP
jgi:hypothetical protein